MQLTNNPSGNPQLLGQTNVGTVSDFLTVCLFSKGPVRDKLNTFVYSTTRTRNIWYIKPGPVQVKIVYSVLYTLGQFPSEITVTSLPDGSSILCI